MARDKSKQILSSQGTGEVIGRYSNGVPRKSIAHGASSKLLKFVEIYEGFNAVEALKRAGYVGEDNYLRYLSLQLLQDKGVRMLLQQKFEKKGLPFKALVLSKEQILEQLSILAIDKKVGVQHRLAALATLGKFKGMSVEKKKVEGKILFGSIVEAANGKRQLPAAKEAEVDAELEPVSALPEPSLEDKRREIFEQARHDPVMLALLKSAIDIDGK